VIFVNEASFRRAIPGPDGPAEGTPARRPHSVRRTTTHDSIRADGMQGPVTVVAAGRDLYTAPDGTPVPISEARVSAVTSYPESVIASISAHPADDRLHALVGRRASSGFRRAVDEAMPAERGTGSVYYQLLDDLPTALLVSGYATLAAAVQRGGGHEGGQQPGQLASVQQLRRRAIPLQTVDMCSGWVDGGAMVSGLEEGIPPFFTGTAAPGASTDDPWAWHAHAAIPAHAMRRRRCLDVWAADEGAAGVEAFFRDSYMDPDGVEMVIHEYTVRAVVDRGTESFRMCKADFGSLPWPECPGALASARRLIGTPVAGLRQRVRSDFTGVGTCTHLNDTLRSLEDVTALANVLQERAALPVDALRPRCRGKAGAWPAGPRSAGGWWPPPRRPGCTWPWRSPSPGRWRATPWR
jgi:hypothetical protein